MKMRTSALQAYKKEPSTLSKQTINKILDDGLKWSLGPTLAQGGSALFPHSFITLCGHQIAAVVQGCLDTHSDQVLVLGVQHTLSNPRLNELRKLESSKQNIKMAKEHGVLGPGIARSSIWENEFSLINFLFLWDEEIKRRGIKPPKLIIRYPFLVNRAPHLLPGIEELEKIAADSIVVATTDPCHHGIAYGHSKETALPISDKARAYANQKVSEGIALLADDDFDKYYTHCQEAKSDARDIYPILRHLKGPMQGTILDLQLIDTTYLYEDSPDPSWVTTCLIELHPLSKH